MTVDDMDFDFENSPIRVVVTREIPETPRLADCPQPRSVRKLMFHIGWPRNLFNWVMQDSERRTCWITIPYRKFIGKRQSLHHDSSVPSTRLLLHAQTPSVRASSVEQTGPSEIARAGKNRNPAARHRECQDSQDSFASSLPDTLRRTAPRVNTRRTSSLFHSQQNNRRMEKQTPRSWRRRLDRHLRNLMNVSKTSSDHHC